MPELSRSMLLDGRMLVLVVVLGGLFSLQSSQNLDAIKIAYLLLAGVSLAAAAIGIRWWLSGQQAKIATPWLVSAAAFAILLVASLAVSISHGTSLASWLRDAAAYALFGAAPVFGLVLARSASRRWIVTMIAGCGVLAAISFAIVWLNLRHIFTVPIDRIVLPSAGLASALVALATALALSRAPRAWQWSILAGLVLGLFFLTGTRATLLLLAVPIGAGFLAGQPWRLGLRTVVVEVAVALTIFSLGASAIAWIGPGAAPSAPATDPASPNLGQRIEGVGTLILDPGSDFSFQERSTQTKVAWEAFLANPLLGVGPGYSFAWTGFGGAEHHQYTLDTPLIYLAKFGVLGLIPFLLFVTASLRMVLSLWRRRSEAETEFLSICGYGIVLVATGVLVSPMEDKGVAFATILLVAFACRVLTKGGEESANQTYGVAAGRDVDMALEQHAPVLADPIA
jgi:hypothetical protein